MWPRASRSSASCDRAAQVAPAVLERLRRPHVGDRVGALVGRPVVGRLGRLAAVVGLGDERLDRVADDVEPARGGDLGAEPARQLRVDDALVRAQVAVRDPALGLEVREVEDGDGGRLRPGARRGRDRQQRLERARRLATLADRRVDVVHDRRRVGRHQVGDLGGVEARAPADADEAVEVPVDREVGRLLQRLRGRLDAGPIEDDRLDAGRLDRRHDPLGDPGLNHAGIADDHHPRGAQALELPAGVGRGARAELDRRRLEGEDGLVRHATPAGSRSRSSAGLRTKRSVARRGSASISPMSDRYVSRAKYVATTVIRPMPAM